MPIFFNGLIWNALFLLCTVLLIPWLLKRYYKFDENLCGSIAFFIIGVLSLLAPVITFKGGTSRPPVTYIIGILYLAIAFLGISYWKKKKKIEQKKFL